ncbi:hypothetical protein VUR80DRAFT_2915 [Thermomyces stellatus]
MAKTSFLALTALSGNLEESLHLFAGPRLGRVWRYRRRSCCVTPALWIRVWLSPWPNGKAFDYESKDCRFESCLDHPEIIIFVFLCLSLFFFFLIFIYFIFALLRTRGVLPAGFVISEFFPSFGCCGAHLHCSPQPRGARLSFRFTRLSILALTLSNGRTKLLGTETYSKIQSDLTWVESESILSHLPHPF